MDENTLRQWQNLATERLNLRFPKIDLKVNQNQIIKKKHNLYF